MKIYVAAPLFNEGERSFNERIDKILREAGHETFLPQREGGCVADLPEFIEGMPKRKYLFQLDCAHMDWCDAVLFVFDGRVPDEGACFELGYCYAKGKRCIGYKTDARSFIDGFDNVMLHGAPETVLYSEEQLREYFEKLRENPDVRWEKSCGAVVYRKTDMGRQYLIEHMALGHASIPKGHIEGRETEAETAAREIWEETGLRVSIDESFRHVVRYSPFEGIMKDVIFFVAEAAEGNMINQESEVSSLEWMGKEEALRTLTYDTDKETLELADQFLDR
ncbi:MAG: nucleoside 2-deoxyribosyltransferase [Clostridia bacterium]|nr:nucleoside 2-deoxyribosyltransferase [Clostridia bacterium]